ncbi:MAG TPA: clostripain-related cysteine peptidase [Ktedonobacteraceae bacterium]
MTSSAWTWMIYMATNNNVELAGEQSLISMRAAIEQLAEQVSVLVQQATQTSSVRRILGASPEVVRDLGQIDSGDPATLIDFIRWAATTAPAQRYALIIWSHGSGWEPSEMERLAKQPVPPVPPGLPGLQPAKNPVTMAELTQRGADDGRKVFFSSTMRKMLSLDEPLNRAIAFDDGSGHSLDTIELGNVLAQATQKLGQPIDLLGMNACLMSNVEVAYQLRNHARVYIASEDLMPAQSWPYDDILARLKAQPGIDAAALGKMVVERYCAFYSAPSPGSGQPQPGVTLTALQIAGVEPLATAVHAFADALQVNIAQQVNAIWAAHRAAHTFPFRLYDLADFCRAFVAQATAAPASTAAANNVLTALTDPAFLLASQYTSKNYDDTGGVTTYLIPPLPGKQPSPYYAETDYSQATDWGKFLIAYFAAVQK